MSAILVLFADLFSLFPLHALFQSMRRSKTLTSMVIGGAILFAGFVFFLYKMAGPH